MTAAAPAAGGRAIPGDAAVHPALKAKLLTTPVAPPARTEGSPWPVLEAAEFLKQSRTTLDRLIRAGKVQSFTIGARRYIPDAEVKRIAAGELSCRAR